MTKRRRQTMQPLSDSRTQKPDDKVTDETSSPERCECGCHPLSKEHLKLAYRPLEIFLKLPNGLIPSQIGLIGTAGPDDWPLFAYFNTQNRHVLYLDAEGKSFRSDGDDSYIPLARATALKYFTTDWAAA